MDSTSRSSLLNPFSRHQAWTDLWKELAKYLPVRFIYALSRVSKGWNDFAWSTLIPVCGIEFHHPTSDTILRYLSRTPRLSMLKYVDFTQGDVAVAFMEQIRTMSLKGLVFGALLPKGYSFGDSIRHLTELEELEISELNLDGFGDILKTFNNLKRFSVFEMPTDLEPSLALLTNLESLTLLKEFCPKHFTNLSSLTNLKTFHLTCDDHEKFFDLCPEWTKLEKLHFFAHVVPRNLNFFTNLTQLKLPYGSFNGTPDSAISYLTNLRRLKVTPDSWFDFSPLTNLTNLHLPSFDEASLESLALLPNLRKLSLNGEVAKVASILKNMTTLEELVVTSDSLEFLSTHTRLKSLKVSTIFGTIKDLSSLTSLQRLKISNTWIQQAEVEALSHLTNITSLSIDFCRDTLLDLVLPHFSPWTKLETLELRPAPGSRFTSRGLSALAGFPRLGKLVLIKCTFCMDDFNPLILLRPPRLEQIILRGCGDQSKQLPEGELILPNSLNSK